MRVRVFLTISVGYVVGQIDSSVHKGDSVMLNYPATVVMVETPEGIGFKLSPLVAPFMKDFRKMMDQFRMRNDMVFFESDADESLIGSYMKFQMNIKAQLSGIIPVSDGSMDNTPPDGSIADEIMKR